MCEPWYQSTWAHLYIKCQSLHQINFTERINRVLGSLFLNINTQRALSNKRGIAMCNLWAYFVHCVERWCYYDTWIQCQKLHKLHNLNFSFMKCRPTFVYVYILKMSNNYFLRTLLLISTQILLTMRRNRVNVYSMAIFMSENFRYINCIIAWGTFAVIQNMHNENKLIYFWCLLKTLYAVEPKN